jgi:LemA protein
MKKRPFGFIYGDHSVRTMMKKAGFIVGGCAAAFFVFILIVTVVWTAGTYNGLVNKDESIDNRWAEVSNNYQFKIDLIGQLVNLTMSYANYENSTLERITALRSAWANPQPGANLENSTKDFDSLASSIIIQVEAYPELKTNQVYLKLMDDITGVEAQIKVARMRYNDDVKAYNTEIRQFPRSIIANSFGFEKRAYFQPNVGPTQPGM